MQPFLAFCVKYLQHKSFHEGWCLYLSMQEEFMLSPSLLGGALFHCP